MRSYNYAAFVFFVLFSWLSAVRTDLTDGQLVMASVRSDGGKHVCTGVPFGSVVLTLASCLKANNVRTPSVEIKVFDNYWKNSMNAVARGVKFHPEYNGAPGSEFDLAAILVGEELEQISYRHASGCQLASQNCDAYLASWESPGSTQVKTLMHSSCKAFHPGVYTDKMVCGSANDPNACVQTLGAPLLVNGALLGLALKPSGCGSPLLFASIPASRAWIDSVSAESKQESSPPQPSNDDDQMSPPNEGPSQPSNGDSPMSPPKEGPSQPSNGDGPMSPPKEGPSQPSNGGGQTPPRKAGPPQPSNSGSQMPPPKEDPPQVTTPSAQTPSPSPPPASPPKYSPAESKPTYSPADSPAAVTSSIKSAIAAGDVDKVASILTQSTDIEALASGFSITGK